MDKTMVDSLLQETISFTTINHVARQRLDLTWIEYGLIDLVHNLSNNPNSSNRWCYASKTKLGSMLGVTEQYVHKIINKAVEKKLLEKHPETRHLRTTQLWFDETQINKNHVSKVKREIQNNTQTKDTKQSLAPLNKVYPDTKQSLDNIDNNKDITKTTYVVLEKSPKTSKVVKKKVDNRNPDITAAIETLTQLLGKRPRKEHLNRFALKRLINSYGLDRTCRAIQYAFKIREEDRFAPQVYNYMDLEEKWERLLDYGKVRSRKGAVSGMKASELGKMIKARRQSNTEGGDYVLTNT